MRERSIQTLLLQSCTWRISLACSGRQYDRGDRVARNGERREKAEEREMKEELLSSPPPPPPTPRLFPYILFFTLSLLSWNRQALLVSGNQTTSNRRSKRARSGYVLCVAFMLNGSQNEFWLHTCYAHVIACVIATWRLVLRDL